MIKKQVLDIISENNHIEITNTTNLKTGGVYMLYVDCFDSKKIIPFYIGETENFQQRHKDHLLEVLSLNRLHTECYIQALLSGLYNGKYKACKIFSYMVNHNCTLNDLHMIVLEETANTNKRKTLEQKYINDLKAPFLGFNQMNCITKSNDYYYGSIDKTEYKSLITSDFENLSVYAQYGYTNFNYFITNEYFSKKQKEYLINYSEYKTTIERKERLDYIKKEITNIRKYNNFECEKLVIDKCGTYIKNYFQQNRLRSLDKQKLVVRVLLFDNERDKKELGTYFAKYGNRLTANLIDKLNENFQDFLTPIKNKLIQNSKLYFELEDEKIKLLKTLLTDLIPIIKYDSHPLKSMYKNHCFEKTDNQDNVCYVNIEFTCYKSNDYIPEICKIDYCFTKNNRTITKEIFIKNQLEDFFEKKDIYYCEKGFASGPFSIYLKGKCGTFIPVTREYENGLNEYVLNNTNSIDIIPAFNEIENLIDEQTKIVYTANGYKSSILRYTETPNLKNMLLTKKLKRLCK